MTTPAALGLLICPSTQTYVVHVRDAVRKTERSYKLSTPNNTVEYCLKGLEPGGRYGVSVRLRNMSKEASYTLSTGTAFFLKINQTRLRGYRLSNSFLTV